MKKSFLPVFVLTSFLLITWSGCKSKNKTTNGPVIGVTMLSLQSEFVVNVKDAIEEAAKKNNVTLIVNDAERTAEKQVQQVETFIVRGVDAIIVNPCEVEASSPAIDKARAAGIPVINVNSETRSQPDAFVGSRDEEAGEIAMEFIASSLGGKGNVVIIDGYMGQAAQIKRAEGSKKILEKYPGLKVLAEQTAQWDRAKGMSLMENWIQSFGDKINAVFAHNDEMGLGALQAIEQAGLKSKIIVVSIDAIDDALKAVKDGRLNATVFQDAKAQGSQAIAIAMKLIQKKQLDEKEIFIPFHLVTKENIGDYYKK